MSRSSAPSHLGFIVFVVLLNLIVTADIGLDAPLIVKITELYGISDLQFSLDLYDPFLALTLVFTFFWGYLSDRLSRKKILIVTVLLADFFILGTALALYRDWPFWAMAGCRVASAIGLAGVIPVSFSMVVDVVPPGERAGTFAWMGIAGLLGTGMGFLLSGLLAWMGVFVPYLIGAGLGFVFALGTWFLPDPVRGQTEEALAEANSKGELQYSYRISPEQLLSLAGKRSNLLFLAFAFVFTVPPAGLGPFFITFMIRNHSLNEFSATLFMCLIFGTQLFGQIYFGRMGDRLYQARPDGRLRVMIWTILASLPFLVAGFGLPFSVQDLPRLVLFSLLVMVGAGLMVGPNPNWMASICDLNLPEHRGTIISLNGLAQTLARIVAAPLCTGLALHLQGSYAHAFLVLFSFFLPAAGLLVLVRRHLAPDVAETQHILSERARAQSNGLTIPLKTGI